MRIWLCVVSVLCWANVVWAQAPAEYPDVPLSDPAYADVNLLGGYTVAGNCSVEPSMTRYEFAVGVARILHNILQNNRSEHVKNLQNNPAAVAAFGRLVKQFTPELRQMGIGREQIELAHKELAASRLGPPAPIVSPPFPDVPKTHWAFNAVESLRQSGIIIGFSENSFTKQSPAATGVK